MRKSLIRKIKISRSAVSDAELVEFDASRIKKSPNHVSR